MCFDSKAVDDPKCRLIVAISDGDAENMKDNEDKEEEKDKDTLALLAEATEARLASLRPRGTTR